jgi:NADH-quinone oxidoreductase subunit G
MQISIGSRGGKVHRIVARDRYVNGLNGEFLDVKARFAHEFIGHADRIKTPMIRYSKGGKLIPATWDAAVKFAADGFKKAAGSVGVIASPRLTNEAVFTLKKFAADAAKTENFAVSDANDLSPIFDNLSVPLATHRDIRYAATIVLIGGEPEEEQTFTAKQIRAAVKNGGAKFICVNDTPINLSRIATQFVHTAPGTVDAFALAAVDPKNDKLVAEKMSVDTSEIDAARKIILETQGDVIIMFGGDLSADAQAILSANAASLAGDGRRVLLHPLAKYNNSVGAFDMTPGRKSVDEVVKNSRGLLIGGSLSEPPASAGSQFVVVQELFLTETTDHADVIFPAASFAEVDGTFTNNAGNVQRVRKAIEPLNQSKPDWMITTLIAREMGVEIAPDWSPSAIFRSIANTIPAYEGLRYPALKDESNPVQAKYEIKTKTDVSPNVKALKESVEKMSSDEKNNVTPKVGHKLHRLTTMTSKTAQFHLLAHGNPKPENLLVSPLAQFELDGTPKANGAEAAAVGAGDRANPGGR